MLDLSGWLVSWPLRLFGAGCLDVSRCWSLAGAMLVCGVGWRGCVVLSGCCGESSLAMSRAVECCVERMGSISNSIGKPCIRRFVCA